MAKWGHLPEVHQRWYVHHIVFLRSLVASNFHEINAKHIGLTINLLQFFEDLLAFGTIRII